MCWQDLGYWRILVGLTLTNIKDFKNWNWSFLILLGNYNFISLQKWYFLFNCIPSCHIFQKSLVWTIEMNVFWVTLPFNSLYQSMLLIQVSFVQIYCFCTQGCVILTFLVTHVKIFMYIEKKIVLPLIALLLFFSIVCLMLSYFLWAHA